ncbi:IQ motif and SEC7 domain-containing protein 3 isoform X1 [Aix galericulata]|nr:IQ motif and SEC7 domain-containing protein 3 isoform X1 [Aix galericulata]
MPNQLLKRTNPAHLKPWIEVKSRAFGHIGCLCAEIQASRGVDNNAEEFKGAIVGSAAFVSSSPDAISSPCKQLILQADSKPCLTEASVQSISSHKNPQNLYSICTAGSKTLSNKLEASSKRAKEQKKHNLKMTQKESRGNEEYYAKFNYCRSWCKSTEGSVAKMHEELSGMKLFYTSSVAQQLTQSRSLHLQTPLQGGRGERTAEMLKCLKTDDDPSGSTSKKAGCETEDPKEAGRQSGQEGRSDTLTLKAQHAELQEEQAAGCSPLVQKASLHHTGSPVRVQRSKGTASCSHAAASDYELSLDLKNKQIEMLEHKYGGHLVSRRAACTIQTAFRQYQLSKNFEKIRNSLLESRMPRRISLRKVRVQNSESFSAEKALVEGYNFVGIPLVRSPSLPATISGALTELEDSFTEQVQSLAKSIDDALSTWSLKTMCSLQDGGSYQIRETFSASSMQPNQDLEAELQDKEKEEGLLPDTLPKSSSTLMMAFRDVTVQIDNKNISVSSSTSVSMANCLSSNAQAGLSQATKAEESPGEGEGETSEPQAAPESLPESRTLQNSHTFTEVNVNTNGTGDSSAEPGQMAVQKLQLDANNETGQSKGSESENADNSEQLSSSSTSTSAKSASEVSSKEALQAMILSLPRYHCENPASCKSPTLSTDTMRKRLYRIGLNLFNINPDKGIQFLISRGFIPDTPIGVAHFLLQRKGLSRQMIGEFLGNSKKQFNRDVLEGL